MENKNTENNHEKINFKLILVLLLIVIVVVSVIIYISKFHRSQEQTKEEKIETENYVKENTSENFAKDRKIDQIEITDIKLKSQEGITQYTATIKNNTTEDFAGGDAKIILINEDGSTYAELPASIPELKAGETNVIDASITEDIVEAYDFRIELEK